MSTTPRELIRLSLKAITAIEAGEAPTSDQHEDGKESLNLLLDSWSADELLPFDHVQVNFSLVAGKTNYTIGDRTTAADADGICASQTPAGSGSQDLTIAGALADGGSVEMDVPRHVVIASDADDSGRTFVITGKNTYGETITESITGPATTTVYGKKQFKTVTIVNVDDDTAGAITVGSDDVIDARRPLMVLSAFVRDGSGNDTPVYPSTRETYGRLSDKDSAATVVSEIKTLYYDSSYPTGEIYIYKVPSVSTFTLYADLWQPFQQITDAKIDSPINLPGQFILALKWNLAVELSPEYGKNVKPEVFAQAISTLELVRRVNSRRPKPNTLTPPIPVVGGQPATNKT